jgi:hypothetical protein
MALLTLLGACATTSSTAGPGGGAYGGGDGLGCERRVIIRGATNEMAGIAAEHQWLRAHYPGSRLKLQSLTRCGESPTDQMTILTRTGEELDIFFDISDFFGKGFAH